MYALNDGRLLTIRRAVPDDLSEIIQIEDESFEFAWDRRDFIRCLRHKGMVGVVATLHASDKVIGYAVYQKVNGNVELLNFAVMSEYRRLGVGRAIIEKLKNNYRSVMCLIRDSNLGAHLFFREQGFLANEIAKEYFENGEDAYCFEHKLEACSLSPEVVDAVIESKFV